MPFRVIKTALCTAAIGLFSVAAGYIGVLREGAEVAREAERLNQQLVADLAQNVRLASLLRGHVDVRRALGAGPYDKDALNRLSLETARAAILVAAPDGRIVATGQRKPSSTLPVAHVPPRLRQTLAANLLSRRFVRTPNQGWLFETGHSVTGPDRRRIGYVLSYQALGDFARIWRALPDALTLSASDGRVLYAHHRFDPWGWTLLRATVPSVVHGTTLTLERNPKAILPYAVVGMIFGLALVLAVVLGLSNLARRRALAKAQITALTRDAETLEALVDERTQALRESQSQLVQAGKFKVLNEMASGLSHELSQPLFALEANLDTLQKQLDPPPAPLVKAQRGVRRMGKILNNLKSFARKDDTLPERTDLSAPVAAAIEILEHEATRRGIAVTHHRPVAPVLGMATPTRLQQVLVNLLSNSFDAVAQDGSGAVQINYLAGPQIRISDNGPGFDDITTALTPFETTKQAQNGLGLGLSISDGIMQSFGGQLILTNTKEGAVVTLRFASRKEAVTWDT